MKRIGLIGPGRLGRSLAAALPQERYPIGPVLSSNFVSARRAVREMRRGSPVKTMADVKDSDYILVTPPAGVTDLAIDQLRSEVDLRRKAVFYCDPTADIALQPADGAFACRLSPLHTFAHTTDDLTDVYFFLDGHPTAVRHARSMLRDCGARVVAAPAGSGPHVAAATASTRDALTAVLDFAVELLVGSGLPHKRAMEAMQPLVASALSEYARGRGRSRSGALADGLTAPPSDLLGLDADRAEIYQRILALTRAVRERNC